MAQSTDAVQIDAHGGAEALACRPIEIAAPAAGQVQVRNLACGVNYIDIYQREGLYPLDLPATLGNEAAGEVVAVGDEAGGYRPGDKVAYCTAGPGCYTQLRNVPAAKLVGLPPGWPPQEAGALLLRGLTAEYLARRCWPVVAGMSALVTAAAGGVGQILCQWLARLGARVIGVVGSPARAARARDCGCDEVVVGYGELASQVRSYVPAGVAVAYDSVGAATCGQCLDSLAPRGCLVSYGNASGPVPPLAPLELAGRGSLFLTRPVLMHYCANASQLQAAAAALFDIVARGLRLPAVETLPLARAAEAHRRLAARQVAGVLALAP